MTSVVAPAGGISRQAGCCGARAEQARPALQSGRAPCKGRLWVGSGPGCFCWDCLCSEDRTYKSAGLKTQTHAAGTRVRGCAVCFALPPAAWSRSGLWPSPARLEQNRSIMNTGRSREPCVLSRLGRSSRLQSGDKSVTVVSVLYTHPGPSVIEF